MKPVITTPTARKKYIAFLVDPNSGSFILSRILLVNMRPLPPSNLINRKFKKKRATKMRANKKCTLNFVNMSVQKMFRPLFILNHSKSR
jgi:hypothetical protein